MLGWALTFLVVALIAGVLGFTTIAGAAIGIAKLVFYVFLLLFVVSLIMNFVRGRGAVCPPFDWSDGLASTPQRPVLSAVKEVARSGS